MTGRLRLGYAALAVGAMIGGALLAASCSKKPTSVDPSYTAPEGTPSSGTSLVTWRELPNVLAKYRNVAPINIKGPEDEFLGFIAVSDLPPETVHGLILDHTPANKFQVFERSGGGGLTAGFDFPLPAKRRWLDGQWDAFEFTQIDPPANPSYIARGIVSGSAGPSSPLTNFSEPDADTLYNIVLKFTNDVIYDPGLPPHPERYTNNDTTVTWDPVPGATQYLVQIYQLVDASAEDIVMSGRPAPINTVHSRDFVVGASTSPLSFGLNQAFSGSTFTNRMPYSKALEYLVRVSAVGSRGQMIGISYVQCESFDIAIDPDPKFYYRFPLAAVRLPHFSKLGDQDKASCQPVLRDLAAQYVALLGGSTTSQTLRPSAFRLGPGAMKSAREVFGK